MFFFFQGAVAWGVSVSPRPWVSAIAARNFNETMESDQGRVPWQLVTWSLLSEGILQCCNSHRDPDTSSVWVFVLHAATRRQVVETSLWIIRQRFSAPRVVLNTGGPPPLIFLFVLPAKFVSGTTTLWQVLPIAVARNTHEYLSEKKYERI